MKYILVILGVMILTGCEYSGMTAVQQAEAIKVCTQDGMLWKHRRSQWDGEVIAIECHQPDIYNIAKEQISYDNCISSNLKYTFTDMDVVRLEQFCSSQSLEK